MRLLILPKKILPDVRKKSNRVALIVDLVGDVDKVVSALKPIEYDTKTRGKRHQAGARLIARGVYVLANHKEPKTTRTFGNHVHLAYVRTLGIISIYEDAVCPLL